MSLSFSCDLIVPDTLFPWDRHMATWYSPVPMPRHWHMSTWYSAVPMSQHFAHDNLIQSCHHASTLAHGNLILSYPHASTLAHDNWIQSCPHASILAHDNWIQSCPHASTLAHGNLIQFCPMPQHWHMVTWYISVPMPQHWHMATWYSPVQSQRSPGWEVSEGGRDELFGRRERACCSRSYGSRIIHSVHLRKWNSLPPASHRCCSRAKVKRSEFQCDSPSHDHSHAVGWDPGYKVHTPALPV
jgi:hypothetical protein